VALATVEDILSMATEYEGFLIKYVYNDRERYNDTKIGRLDMNYCIHEDLHGYASI
jgi:hypothetical protein